MKKIYLSFLLLFNLVVTGIFAQDSVPQYMIRIYEDNDCLNLTMPTTDDAYTNGTRFDLFYTKNHKSRLFLDRWMPKAGQNSTDVYSLSLMQVMNTPSNLSLVDFQPHDYPYSGALYTIHSLYSYNALKKYDFQTEVVAGFMGPDALTKQTQSLVHKVIGDQQPMGWPNELKTDVLLNVNFAAEKELAGYNNVFELIGGGQVLAGTMTDAANCYTIIRLGEMSSYFSGYISQYTNEGKATKKTHAYLFAKPGVEYVAYNSLLEGGVFTGLPDIKQGFLDKGVKEDYPPIENVVAYVSYGMAAGYEHLGVSYSETTSTATVKGLYSHTVGNISVFYTF